MNLRFAEYRHGGPSYQEAVQLRQDALRTPLGLEFSTEELAAESAERHFAAFDGDTVIASLSFRLESAQIWKMRQVVVAPCHRGRHVGVALVRFAESIALTEGATEIVLHARESVLGFYEKLGYEVEGAPFTEVTLPHRRMRKALAHSREECS